MIGLGSPSGVSLASPPKGSSLRLFFGSSRCYHPIISSINISYIFPRFFFALEFFHIFSASSNSPKHFWIGSGLTGCLGPVKGAAARAPKLDLDASANLVFVEVRGAGGGVVGEGGCREGWEKVFCRGGIRREGAGAVFSENQKTLQEE